MARRHPIDMRQSVTGTNVPSLPSRQRSQQESLPVCLSLGRQLPDRSHLWQNLENMTIALQNGPWTLNCLDDDYYYDVEYPNEEYFGDYAKHKNPSEDCDPVEMHGVPINVPNILREQCHSHDYYTSHTHNSCEHPSPQLQPEYQKHILNAIEEERHMPHLSHEKDFQCTSAPQLQPIPSRSEACQTNPHHARTRTVRPMEEKSPRDVIQRSECGCGNDEGAMRQNPGVARIHRRPPISKQMHRPFCSSSAIGRELKRLVDESYERLLQFDDNSEKAHYCNQDDSADVGNLPFEEQSNNPEVKSTVLHSPTKDLPIMHHKGQQTSCTTILSPYEGVHNSQDTRLLRLMDICERQNKLLQNYDSEMPLLMKNRGPKTVYKKNVEQQTDVKTLSNITGLDEKAKTKIMERLINDVKNASHVCKEDVLSKEVKSDKDLPKRVNYNDIGESQAKVNGDGSESNDVGIMKGHLRSSVERQSSINSLRPNSVAEILKKPACALCPMKVANQDAVVITDMLNESGNSQSNVSSKSTSTCSSKSREPFTNRKMQKFHWYYVKHMQHEAKFLEEIELYLHIRNGTSLN